MALLIMVATLVANLAYFVLIKIAGAVYAGQVAYFNAICGVGWGVVVLGENLSWGMVLALALILCGLTLVRPARAARRMKPPKSCNRGLLNKRFCCSGQYLAVVAMTFRVPDFGGSMQSSSNLRGIIYMVLAGITFVSCDSFLKLMLREVPPLQSLVLRGISATVWCFCLLAVMGQLRHLPKALERWTMLRSLAEVCAVTCFHPCLGCCAVGGCDGHLSDRAAAGVGGCQPGLGRKGWRDPLGPYWLGPSRCACGGAARA